MPFVSDPDVYVYVYSGRVTCSLLFMLPSLDEAFLTIIIKGMLVWSNSFEDDVTAASLFFSLSLYYDAYGGGV